MKLKFGKYKGMTLEQAVKTDPKYCRGLIERNAIADDMKKELVKVLNNSPAKKHHAPKLLLHKIGDDIEIDFMGSVTDKSVMGGFTEVPNFGVFTDEEIYEMEEQ